MRSMIVFFVVIACARAAFPFLNFGKPRLQETLKEGSNAHYYGTILNNITYPFQRTLIANGTYMKEYTTIKTYYNSTTLYLDAQFLQLSNEGSMLPVFNTPLNGSIITARVHTYECYPYQGGYYYRNNATMEYGETSNELVFSRATSNSGTIVANTSRPWGTRIAEAKSIVLSNTQDGIILCANINWQYVDGAFSSIVSVTTLLAVMGLIMKQVFMD